MEQLVARLAHNQEVADSSSASATMIKNRNIEKAYIKGYRVDEQGRLVSPKGVVRKARKSLSGYLCVSIRINGRMSSVYVHQIAASQKFGEEIFSSECVRHLDGNPLNNKLTNIEIGTQSENIRDIPAETRKRSANIATSYIRKWDKKVVRKYYEENGKSYKKTKEFFGISSKGTLWYILNK